MSGARVSRTDAEAISRNHEERILALERAPSNPARMPWILFQGNLDGVTVPASSASSAIVDFYPEITGLLVNPLDGGGDVDATVYGGIDLSGDPVPIMTGGSSNEPFEAIQILVPGLYAFEVSITWYYDWTIQEDFAERYFTIRHQVTHTDGDQSVIDWFNYVLSTEATYQGLVPQGADEPDMSLGFQLMSRTYLAIDERATDVQVSALVNNVNEVGDDRTYDSGATPPRGGSFDLTIIQLNQSGHSDPPI